MQIDYSVRGDGQASDLFMRIPEEKRRRIINVAVREFAGHGFTGANVNRIARGAGISVGALYKYFPSKERLFMHIVEVAAAGLDRYVREIIEADIRLSSKLERLLRLAQDYSRQDPDLIRLYNVFSTESDCGRAEFIAGKLESITAKAYRDLIRQAQEKGQVRDDIDPGILAFLIDNQLLVMQYSFACGYHQKRISLFVGEKNIADNEYLIHSMIKALETMLGIRPGGQENEGI
ncbi:MAG TPA: TetR/AcrR family transcriptional regulator [Bacillota bacterium]|jgi:TetR/AcrR family transcriptional regulator|nr:TetR/AcrR family transcriptional regulator [Bacillota bacterium]HQB81292.1 TetR/AcrR family transcriptional regulator [Bacillota bacterium]